MRGFVYYYTLTPALSLKGEGVDVSLSDTGRSRCVAPSPLRGEGWDEGWVSQAIVIYLLVSALSSVIVFLAAGLGSPFGQAPNG